MPIIHPTCQLVGPHRLSKSPILLIVDSRRGGGINDRHGLYRAACYCPLRSADELAVSYEQNAPPSHLQSPIFTLLENGRWISVMIISTRRPTIPPLEATKGAHVSISYRQLTLPIISGPDGQYAYTGYASGVVRFDSSRFDYV